MDIKKYNEFVKGLELEEIVLSELDSKRISEPEKGHWVFDVKHDFSLILKSEEKLKAKAQFIVSTQNKDSGQELFSIKAVFLINYKNSSKIELTEEMEKRFINTNIPLNIWPYAREIVSSLSTRMGYPPLIIGTFKVF